MKTLVISAAAFALACGIAIAPAFDAKAQINPAFNGPQSAASAETLNQWMRTRRDFVDEQAVLCTHNKLAAARIDRVRASNHRARILRHLSWIVTSPSKEEREAMFARDRVVDENLTKHEQIVRANDLFCKAAGH